LRRASFRSNFGAGGTIESVIESGDNPAGRVTPQLRKTVNG
jgi:hypothetical protein